MNIIEGSVLTENIRIAIIVSKFNRIINNYLLDGAIDILKRIGCVQDNNITVVWVPGAYELPVLAKVLSESKKYDALIALGTVIKGITKHFEYISKSCILGLSKISIQYKLPIGLGVLTTDNFEQAIKRSGIKNNNTGSAAALSVLEMINVLKQI